MFCSPEIRRPKAETRKKAEIRRPKDLNIEHRTSNIQWRWRLPFRYWMFDVSFFALLRSSNLGFEMARTDFRAALGAGENGGEWIETAGKGPGASS